MEGYNRDNYVGMEGIQNRVKRAKSQRSRWEDGKHWFAYKVKGRGVMVSDGLGSGGDIRLSFAGEMEEE